jgi:hypothetical protein
MQTAEELETEIAEITTALSNITKTGQSYTINSGGGSRTFTAADYSALVKRRKDAISELATVNSCLGGMIGKAW